MGLPAETETKLDVKQASRRPKSGQIRKAVKRYSEMNKRYKKIRTFYENASIALYR